jgi:hypothetical protein
MRKLKEAARLLLGRADAGKLLCARIRRGTCPERVNEDEALL